MSLKETTKTMREMLEYIEINLGRAAAGNKAAAQRVRVMTVKLEVVAKRWRKESVREMQ